MRIANTNRQQYQKLNHVLAANEMFKNSLVALNWFPIRSSVYYVFFNFDFHLTENALPFSYISYFFRRVKKKKLHTINGIQFIHFWKKYTFKSVSINGIRAIKKWESLIVKLKSLNGFTYCLLLMIFAIRRPNQGKIVSTNLQNVDFILFRGNV